MNLERIETAPRDLIDAAWSRGLDGPHSFPPGQAFAILHVAATPAAANFVPRAGRRTSLGR